jgi:hypothetical protein
MAKISASLLAALAFLSIPAPSALAQSDQQFRFEVGLYFGPGKSLAEGRSTYHNEWSTPALSRVVENDLLSLNPGAAFYGGGFLSYFVSPHLGVQAGFGYLKSSLSGSSLFDFSLPPGFVSARRDQWDSKGEITAVPLCLNLAGRTGPAAIQAFASGGIAVFLNSFFAESFAGLGASAAGGGADEKIDAFKVPVSVADQTWTSIGADIGGGFDIRLGKSLALTAEVRYFLCPPKDFAWTWTPGLYEGLGKYIAGRNISQEEASLASRRTTPVTINPSVVQASVGIKFFLPGIVKISAGSAK